jgi:hypothetical protein
MKEDPVRAALEPKNAALFAAAYTSEIIKEQKAHGIEKPTAEQVIYGYNDDVNSYGSGKDKGFVSVSLHGEKQTQQLIHHDLRREKYPTDPRILEHSQHVKHVMHALDEVNKKAPLLDTPKSPEHKQDSTRQEKPHKTGTGTENQEFIV